MYIMKMHTTRFNCRNSIVFLRIIFKFYFLSFAIIIIIQSSTQVGVSGFVL